MPDSRPDMRQRALFVTSNAACRWNKMLLAELKVVIPRAAIVVATEHRARWASGCHPQSVEIRSKRAFKRHCRTRDRCAWNFEDPTWLWAFSTTPLRAGLTHRISLYGTQSVSKRGYGRFSKMIYGVCAKVIFTKDVSWTWIYVT